MARKMRLFWLGNGRSRTKKNVGSRFKMASREKKTGSESNDFLFGKGQSNMEGEMSEKRFANYRGGIRDDGWRIFFIYPPGN